MSNNLIILKTPIRGYNNHVQIATDDMKFGVNHNLNYCGNASINIPKKIQETLDKQPVEPKIHKTPSHKLETLDNKQIEPKKYQKIPQPIGNSNNNDLVAIMYCLIFLGF